MPSLKTRIRWFIAAILVVCLIILAANGFFLRFLVPVAAKEAAFFAPASVFDLLMEDESKDEGQDEDRDMNESDGGDMNESDGGDMNESEADLSRPENLELRVLEENQPDKLRYGSSVEVFRFLLDSEGPYTVRYISFRITSSGLVRENLAAGNWHLYLSKDGENYEIDYSDPVGKGEDFLTGDATDGVLKMRLGREMSTGLVLEEGKTEFVLEAYVIKADEDAINNVSEGIAEGEAPTSQNPPDQTLTDQTLTGQTLTDQKPYLEVDLSNDYWAFVPGRFTKAWLTLDEIFHAEFVNMTVRDS